MNSDVIEEYTETMRLSREIEERQELLSMHKINLIEEVNDMLQIRRISYRELSRMMGVSHTLVTCVFNLQSTATKDFCVKLHEVLLQET